jgi:tetratricopeptide (TPR) repeat protein
MAFRTLRISELEPIAAAGLHWLPLRHLLGVQAFGVNAYTGPAPGDDVIEQHTEEGLGHEELYVVIAGRARFTLDDETLDAPAGTLVFLPDPATRRYAVAEEPGTTVLAVGGKPGAGYEISAWEWRFRAQPHLAAGEWDKAEALIRESLEQHPGDGASLYDLACVEARDGRHDAAIEHLRAALAARPEVREWGAEDRDLDALRERDDFPRLNAAESRAWPTTPSSTSSRTSRTWPRGSSSRPGWSRASRASRSSSSSPA